jgi:hypothetical protein
MKFRMTEAGRAEWLALFPQEKAGSGFGGLHLGDTFVELAGDVRNDAELALDEHELGSMMHFVLFSAENALEARLDGGAIGIGYAFFEKLRRESIEPGGKGFAFRAQQIQNFRLTTKFYLFGMEAIPNCKKIESNESVEAKCLVDFQPEAGRDGDMRKHAGHGAGLGSGRMVIAGFRNIFRYLDGIFANSSKSGCEFTAAVWHGDTSLIEWPAAEEQAGWFDAE